MLKRELRYNGNDVTKTKEKREKNRNRDRLREIEKEREGGIDWERKRERGGDENKKKESNTTDSILDASHKVSVIKIKYSGFNKRNKQKAENEYPLRDNGMWESFF